MWSLLIGLGMGVAPAADAIDDVCLSFGRRRLPVARSHFDEPNHDPWPGLTISGGTASWARLARTLEVGRLPPPGAVRAEELVQALPVEAVPPLPGHELAVQVESSISPWGPTAAEGSGRTAMVRVTLTARRPRFLDRPPAHLVLVVDEVADDVAALSVARAALQELVGGLRDDDTVAIIGSGGEGRVVLEPTPWSEVESVRAGIERIRAADSGVLPQALSRAMRVAEAAPADELRRVLLVSDGDLGLIERGSRLSAGAATFAEIGVGLAGLGYGEKHARDDSVEAIVRAAGGPMLHLAYPFDGRELADHLGGLLEPAARDVRVLVEWNDAQVVGVHRVGNHLDRLTGLGPRDEAVGGELGAGQTATVLYEVELHPHARGADLGRVRVRSSPPGQGPRERASSIPGRLQDFEEASSGLRLAVAAASLGEVLAGEQSVERVAPERIADIAAAAARPEYARDQELVGLADRAAELVRTREACHDRPRR